MINTYRCVVTGRDRDGQSVVVKDQQVETGLLGSADFWRTTKCPASLTDEDATSGSFSLEPPPAGTIFRFFEIPPQDPSMSPEEVERAAAQAFAAVGASHCRVDTRRNPMMHTTSTIDYVVVLKGRMTLLLDADQIELNPFDVVVQRGTNHYWLNYGTEPALLMGVLLDAR
ncbi:MAG: cupin domain-containing protein [Desulfomonilaceae bacterium]